MTRTPRLLIGAALTGMMLAASHAAVAQNLRACAPRETLVDKLGNDFGEAVTVFHAGTKVDPDGTLRAAGGRVLNVCGRGPTLREALDRAYAAVDRIDWPGGFCRRDIGWRALQR